MRVYNTSGRKTVWMCQELRFKTIQPQAAAAKAQQDAQARQAADDLARDDAEKLKQAAVTKAKAEEIRDAVALACALYDITTPVSEIKSNGNADQKPITLCQFQSRALPLRPPLKTVMDFTFDVVHVVGHQI